MRRRRQLDRDRYEILHKMLEDRAHEITEKLRSLREGLSMSVVEAVDPDQIDPDDHIVQEYARGLDFALIEMKSRTLEHINEAMRKLDEGTYGVCADCDGQIAKPRLQALPFAERCRDCEQAREELAAETARQKQRFEEKRIAHEASARVARLAPAPKRRQVRRKKIKSNLTKGVVVVGFGPLAGPES
jgi:DnaK suppressor protein